MRAGRCVPGYWPQDEGDLSDDGEDVCGIDMCDGMPMQYYRPCVKAVGANRTEPDLRAGNLVLHVDAPALPAPAELVPAPLRPPPGRSRRADAHASIYRLVVTHLCSRL